MRTATRDHARSGRLTHDTMLEAACAAFAVSGFRDANMDDIAVRAGTTKPTLYARVRSKEELYALTVEAEAQRVIEFLLDAYGAAADAPIPERTRAFVKAFFDYAEARPEGFRLLFVLGPPAHGNDTVDRAFAEVTDHIADVVRGDLERFGNPPDAADLLATMFVGMVYRVVKRSVEERSWDAAATIDVLTSFVTAGSVGIDPETLQVHAQTRRRSRKTSKS